jgi:hypothetical protein
VGNFYNPPWSAENQCFASYLIDVAIDKTNVVTQEFFSLLSNGWTVNKAREKSYQYYDPDCPVSERIARSHQWMAIYGDWATRLHGVYTGTEGRTLAWYR